MLNVKEGQTYVCKRDDLYWWTLNKEYKVVSDKSNELVIIDDNNDKWGANSSILTRVFKLKEKEFDLNKLTINELDEYVDLQQALELAKNELNAFIERMTK